MKPCGVLLIVVGSITIAMSLFAFGDIGISMLMAGAMGLIAGIGLVAGAKRVKALEDNAAFVARQLSDK